MFSPSGKSTSISDTQAVDYDVCLRLRRLRVVYLHRFTSQLQVCPSFLEFCWYLCVHAHCNTVWLFVEMRMWLHQVLWLSTNSPSPILHVDCGCSYVCLLSLPDSWRTYLPYPHSQSFLCTFFDNSRTLWAGKCCNWACYDFIWLTVCCVWQSLIELPSWPFHDEALDAGLGAIITYYCKYGQCKATSNAAFSILLLCTSGVEWRRCSHL